MIIVKLIGGLGNQMFQYAAGRALAMHHNTPLFLDKTTLEEDAKGAYTQRKFELSCFNIDERFASQKELELFKDGKSNRLQRVVNRLFPQAKSKLTFHESGHIFHSNFFSLPTDTFLIGFWQSEKYFSGIANQIRKDFTLKAPVPSDVKQTLSLINNVNSVSLHVRRGDYVSLKSASEFHGLIGLEHYTKAISFIENKKPGTEIFIFSDDIAWCKENLKFDQMLHFVEHSSGAEWDMFLMSQCKHNIIANSSFSWWGAWLNTNPEKIVIIPEHWFAGKKSIELDRVAKNWQVL